MGPSRLLGATAPWLELLGHTPAVLELAVSGHMGGDALAAVLFERGIESGASELHRRPVQRHSPKLDLNRVLHLMLLADRNLLVTKC